MENQSLSVYKPCNLGSFVQDIINKSGELGLDADGIRKLNVERYINNLNALQKDGNQLSIMPEQTKEMVHTAIYQNPDAIKYANEQDEFSKTLAISRKPSTIQYIHEPSDEDIQLVIDLDVSCFCLAKKHSKEKIMLALEKSPHLIFSLKKDVVDEDIMIFVIDLLKNESKRKGFYRYDMDLLIPYFMSPLEVFNNEKTQNYALSISPMLLNFINPHELDEKTVIEIIKEEPAYFKKIKEFEYIIKRDIAVEILKIPGISKIVYDLVRLLDYDCAHTDFFKTIVDAVGQNLKYYSDNEVEFFELLRAIKESRLESFAPTFISNIEYVFKDHGTVGLWLTDVGFSNKKVIKIALKRNPYNKMCVNFWKTKVIKR